MGLGGDLERLLSMLERAGVEHSYDRKALAWIKVPGATFYFESTGVKLSCVTPDSVHGDEDEEETDPSIDPLRKI